jgi:hypothetical protein
VGSGWSPTGAQSRNLSKGAEEAYEKRRSEQPIPSLLATSGWFSLGIFLDSEDGVFCLSVISVFFTGLSRRRVLPSTGLQSSGNPLKAILHVPSREHLVGQLSFPVGTQTTLVVAITEVYLALVWQWTLVVTLRLTIRYLGIASRWLVMDSPVTI